MTSILPLPNQTVRYLGAQPHSTQTGSERDQAQGRPAWTMPSENHAARPQGARDTIQVSQATLAAYAKENTLSLPLAKFSTPEQAAKYLEQLLTRMVASAETIKTLVHARQALVQPANIEIQGEARVAQMHALQVGQQLAAEKDLQRLSAALAKAFDLDGPIYRQEGGAVSFNPTDFNFAGRLLAQLMPDGRAAMLIEEEKQGLLRAGLGLGPPVASLPSWVSPAGFAPGLVVAVVVILAFILMF